LFEQIVQQKPAFQILPRPCLEAGVFAGFGAFAATLGKTAAGMVDQQLSHLPAGGGGKVGPVLKSRSLFQEQADDRFVDKGRGLERVALALTAHQVSRDGPQGRVDGFQQAIQSVGLAPARRCEEQSDLAWFAILESQLLFPAATNGPEAC
jgi:hypothetical protein